MADNIAGKVVVITGASSGLGEAAARHLHAQGATVVLGARRVERLNELAAELGDRALVVQTDVTRRAEVQRLIDTAVERFGRIDVLLNNAGLMPLSPLERLKVEDWEQMIDVNIKGVLYGIAAALPHMQRQQSGHIINVSSVAGHKVRPGSSVYSATKHAVRALSEGLRQEVTPRFPQGLTVWQAGGQWRRSDGAIVRERSKVLILVHDEKAEVRSAVTAIVERYKQLFEQESVLWETARVCAAF